MVIPNNWPEEERENFAEEIASTMVLKMTQKEMTTMVWGVLYDLLVEKEWPELWQDAEEFTPYLVEDFLKYGPEGFSKAD